MFLIKRSVRFFVIDFALDLNIMALLCATIYCACGYQKKEPYSIKAFLFYMQYTSDRNLRCGCRLWLFCNDRSKCTVNVILFGFLFVNHFIINSDHHSRPVNIFINQLLVIAIAVITIVSLSFPVVWDNEFSVILEAVSWHIGQVASIMMIASYESVFNAYKINRENSLD